MQIGQLEIELMADIARLRRDLDNAQRVVGDATSRISGLANLAKGALGALGGAISMGALLASVTDAIGVLGDLDDMAQKTGASVENLSRMQKVATVFDGDMGKIDAAVVKLAKGMASADEESSKARKALEALGISARDSSGQLRDPAEVMIEMATRLQNYKDGAAKTALINDALGKSGADLLPYLNDLAENYDKVSAETKESAGAAAALQDQMGWAQLRVKELSGVVAAAAVPAINDLFGAFTDVAEAQQGVVTPDVRIWADDAAVGIARVADVAVTLPRIFGAVASSFKVVIADLEVLSAIAKLKNPANVALEYARGNDPMAEIRKAVTERNRVLAEANQKYDDLWNKPANQFEQAVLRRIADRGAAAAAATEQATQGVLNYSSATDEAAKAAKREADEQAKLLAELSGVTGSYMEDLSRLVKIRDQGNISEARYVELVTDLIAKQPGVIKAEQDRIKAAKEAADFEKRYNEAVSMTSDILDQRVKDTAAEVTRNEELAHTYGMTKLAIEQEELARLRNQLSQASQQGLTLKDIEHLKEMIALRERNAAAIGAMEQVDAANKAREEWKRASDDINRSLTDALLRGFESGKSFGRNLIDTLKNMFNTLILRPVIQAVVQPAANQLTGLLQGAGGVGGAGGSAIGNIGSLVSTFGSMFGSTSIGAFGQGMGMTQMAAARMGGGAYSAGASAAPVLSVAGWIAAGMALADGLFKKGFDPNNGSVNTALTNPLIPGAMHNNKIFQALGMNERWANMFSGASVVTALFGRKNPEIQSSALWGNLTSETGFQGAQRDYWTAKGGLFRSDKDGYNYTPVSTETYEFLSDTYKALREATKGFAEAIGADATSIATRTDAINVAIGKTEEETQKNLTAYFEGLANTMAADLVPSLVNFQKSGESAAATLQRLATDYAMVDQVLTSIGMAFAQVGVESLAARERLIANSGGADSFAANTAGFAQNFLTEDQRNAPVLAAVRKELDAMGLAAVDTREEFAAVVLGLNVANEAESERFGKLIQLQGAFAQVYPATQAAVVAEEDLAAARELANRERSMDAQILRLQGDAIGALRIERELELAGMPELLHARQKHIWALEDEATAQQAAAAAWEREREIGNQARRIEAQRLTLIGDAEGALRIQRDLELETLPQVLHEAQKYNWALEDQAAAAKAAKDAADQLAAADAKRISDWSEMYNNAAAAQAKAEADRVAAAEKAAAEAKALADKGLSMDAQVFRLQGDAAKALRIERDLELKGIPELLHARQEYIWTLQDEAAALEKAQAVADQKRQLEIEIMRLTGDAAGALAAERELEIKKYDPANQALKKHVWALQDEAEKAKAAADAVAQASAFNPDLMIRQAQADMITNAEKAWRSIGESLIDEVNRIRGVMQAASVTSLADAEAKFAIASAQARAGDINAAKLLPEMSRALLDMAEQEAVTTLDLRRIQAATAASLQLTAGVANGVNFRSAADAQAWTRPAYVAPTANTVVQAESPAMLAEMKSMREEMTLTREAVKRHVDLYEANTEGGGASKVIMVDVNGDPV